MAASSAQEALCHQRSRTGCTVRPPMTLSSLTQCLSDHRELELSSKASEVFYRAQADRAIILQVMILNQLVLAARNGAQYVSVALTSGSSITLIHRKFRCYPLRDFSSRRHSTSPPSTVADAGRTSTTRIGPSKSHQYSFASDQTWCTSAETLSFVDEGQALQSAYESRSESELEEDATSSLAGERIVDILPVHPHPTSVSTDLEYQGAPESTSIEPFSPIPRLDAFSWIPSDDGHQEKGTPGLPSDTTTNDQPPLYREVSMWPLANANEANLVRYYIDHVSRIFDICDPERHFSLVVPWRAAMCPPLMDAVLALSARWLSRSTNFDEYVADRYQQRCLNSMVPMLGDPDALLNQDLFAAIVILRTLEEIEVPLSGADSGTHLFGGHLFVSASASGQSPASDSQKTSELSGLAGLRQAAFRVAFRQEVFTAFVSQRPVTPAFCLKDVIRSVDVPTDDCTWCHRILLHLADALEFCFPDSSIAADNSVKRYEELVAYGDQWYLKTPQSFRPIFFKEANRNSLDDTEDQRTLSPDIWMLSDAVATAMLNYHLSRILLLAFDPRTPRLGPSRAQFLKRQNQEIKQEVKTLIGVTNGNAQCAPNILLGCAGVALAGDRFEARWEQEELIMFLKKAETLFAWSTSAAQHHLMEAWSWMETDV